MDCELNANEIKWDLTNLIGIRNGNINLSLIEMKMSWMFGIVEVYNNGKYFYSSASALFCGNQKKKGCNFMVFILW